MTMLHSAGQRVAMVFTALLAFALAGACGRDDSLRGARADPTPPPPTSGAQAQTTRVTVGLTGLILIVPASDPKGAVKLYMPPTPDHVSYVGFHDPKVKKADCDAYNDAFGICFMNLEGSALAPIGTTSNTPSTVPSNVLSISQHSGNSKADTTAVKGKIRSRATLGSGSATSPCAVGRWTIKPYGQAKAHTIEPANVMTWEMPAVQGQQVVLARTPLSASSTLKAKSFTVSAEQGRLELLVVHISEEEFIALQEAKPGRSTGSPLDAVNLPEINDHLAGMYNLISAPRQKHAFAESVHQIRPACPIPVLGLEKAAFPVRRATGPGLAPTTVPGVRTLSCVMGVADEG